MFFQVYRVGDYLTIFMINVLMFNYDSNWYFLNTFDDRRYFNKILMQLLYMLKMQKKKYTLKSYNIKVYI